MKKLLSLLTVLILVFTLSAAAADLDLASMSREELLALEQQIIKELTSRDDYKEVIVPVGVYKVGEDIPAGKWTISGKDYAGNIVWGKALDQYKVEIPYADRIADFSYWGPEDSTTWELVEGTYIVIDISPVKFSTPMPTSLGF